MTVRLVDGEWGQELKAAAKANPSEIRISTPFLKQGAVEDVFDGVQPEALRILTRFNLEHFNEGVSDISALKTLMDLGARVRGVKRLHAKMYMFGPGLAVITSANLTGAGLSKNHELGVVAEGGVVAADCREYFDQLWDAAGPDLASSRLRQWGVRLEEAQANSGPAPGLGLGDEGVDLGQDPLPDFPPPFDEPHLGFVKFFGEGHNRAERNYAVLEEVERAGCHWACTYPVGKRPRMPRDGSLMFMGRLVHSPDDTKIYGRAVAIRHQEGRDDATPADLLLRPWKKAWPHYVRVHHGEYLAGPLENGVSLGELMDELGAHAFGPTLANLERAKGNMNPRMSIRQAPAIRLSADGLRWLNEQLEQAFAAHGKLQPGQLAQLDWPDVVGLNPDSV